MSTIIAHPQINPLNFNESPETLVGKIPPELLNVYSIIWKGSAAYLAEEPILRLNQITYQLDKKFFLMLVGVTVDEEGWLQFDPSPLNNLKQTITNSGEVIKAFYDASDTVLDSLAIEEHIQSKPSYYSLADLLDVMVKKGVGRPSTYASSIDRLIASKGKPYAYLEENGLRLNTKAFEVLDYLEAAFPEVKFNSEFSNNLENDLDRIAEGVIKASDVIKCYVEEVVPELADIKDEWWIDTLIGEEPEKLTAVEDEFSGQEEFVSIEILNVDRYLSPTDPCRTLKFFLDACLDGITQKALSSTQLESYHRIVKASVIQSLLRIESSKVFLAQLRFNYIFQWIVGLKPLHEIWSVKFYENMRNNPDILDQTRDILSKMKENKAALEAIKRLGLNVL